VSLVLLLSNELAVLMLACPVEIPIQIRAASKYLSITPELEIDESHLEKLILLLVNTLPGLLTDGGLEFRN